METRNLLVLGAGLGSRMGALTQDRPKIGIELASGLTLGDVLTFAIREYQWQQKVVVLGHKAENVCLYGFDRVVNTDFVTTNMPHSLLLGMKSLRHTGDIIVIYGDLIVDNIFLRPLVYSKKQIAVASLLDFENIWKSRFIKPEDDAESFVVDGQGLIRNIGKPIRNLEEAQGQFGGALKIGAEMADSFVASLESFCRERPTAFLTDFLQQLIESGVKISAENSRGVWYELDTPNDLQFALGSSEVQLVLAQALEWRESASRED